MGARYEGPKIEIYRIFECPITKSGDMMEQEIDNVIDDAWE